MDALVKVPLTEKSSQVHTISDCLEGWVGWTEPGGHRGAVDH